MTLHLALHSVCFVWRMIVDAAVRTLFVIEKNSFLYGLRHLFDTGKRMTIKQFVLDGTVDTLSQ